MKKKELAYVAVTITDIIKNNLDQSPGEVIQKILTALPNVDINDLVLYLTSMGNELAIDHIDVHDLLQTLQNSLKEAVSPIHWNSILQEIAQGILSVAAVAAKVIFPKWSAVITAIVVAYEELKTNK